jgi:Protein of unknown function (DUF616)
VSPRCCVYTVLTGRYEKLNEQPVARESAIPFICLSDDPDLISETWKIRPLTPVFGMDDIRNQREYKLRPHRHLPTFDVSLYIDNSVLLSVIPEKVFDIADLSSGLCLPEHSFRETVLDEFLAVAEENLDDPARIFEQLNHYGIDFHDSLGEKPCWSAILLRDHRNPIVIAAMEIWIAHVNRYSRRDQLSARVAFRQAGLRPSILHIDNHRSWFHSWPHSLERKTERRSWQAEATLEPISARMLPLEQPAEAERPHPEHSLTELMRKYDAVLAATTKRLMGELARVRESARSETARVFEALAVTNDQLNAAERGRAESEARATEAEARATEAAARATGAEARATALTCEREAARSETARMAMDLAAARDHVRAVERSRAEAERAADEAKRAKDAVVYSTSWRLLAPLHAVGRRHPRIARALRRCVKLVWWTVTLQTGRRYATWRRHQAVLAAAAKAPSRPAAPPLARDDDTDSASPKDGRLSNPNVF